MPIRNFADVPYIPLLSVRPAEMKALQELPDRDKGRLLPYVCLRPWTTAHRLDSTLARIEQAYGRRPYIADITPDEPLEGNRRPVHDELDRLREPSDGYSNWYEFIAAHRNLIPALQIADVAEIPAQVAAFSDLDRGLVVRFPEPAFGRSQDIAGLIHDHIKAPSVCVIFDFERQTRELLARALQASQMAEGVHQVLPGCFVCFSASSFPESFTEVSEQEIYERQFFDAVVEQTGGDQMIYGDRGSARVERQAGGGGLPAPRIDYPLQVEWRFFREDDAEDRTAAYRRAAERAMRFRQWDGNLRLWGSQMIERTAFGDTDAINSPMRSTSARINIHLHRQLFYGDDPGALYNTDEDWSDL